MTNNITKNLTVEWKSPSNLAIVKYWGKRDIQQPLNPSISFSLKNAVTTTRVTANPPKQGGFTFLLDGNQKETFNKKIDNLLQLAYFRDNLHQQHLIIRSEKNNAFPQTGRRVSLISTCVPRLGHQGSKRCREYRIVFSEHFVQLTKDAALLRIHGSISLNNSQEF